MRAYNKMESTMRSIRIDRLTREICGRDTGSMSSSDRETVIPISLVIGLVAVVLLGGCQQTVAPLAVMPATLNPVYAAAENATGWMAVAHAQAARNGSGEQTADLSY